MDRNWNDFLAPYEQAVSELKVKLRGIRKQFRDQKQHVPIEFVTGRVKPVESILAKSQLRGIPLDRLEEEMSDIAGLRIMSVCRRYPYCCRIITGTQRYESDYRA